MAKEILKIKPKNTEPAEILRNEKLAEAKCFQENMAKEILRIKLKNEQEKNAPKEAKIKKNEKNMNDKKEKGREEPK